MSTTIRNGLGIVLTALAFVIVFLGGPWFLALGGLSWPLIVMFLLACLAALLIANWFWGWWSPRTPVA